jgi:hypothetical protein
VTHIIYHSAAGEYITNAEARRREKAKQGSRCFLYDLELHSVRKEVLVSISLWLLCSSLKRDSLL